PSVVRLRRTRFKRCGYVVFLHVTRLSWRHSLRRSRASLAQPSGVRDGKPLRSRRRESQCDQLRRHHGIFVNRHVQCDRLGVPDEIARWVNASPSPAQSFLLLLLLRQRRPFQDSARTTGCRKPTLDQADGRFPAICALIKAMASPTVTNSVALWFGISMSNFSSNDMTTSTTSRLSAPRSSISLASSVSSASSDPR